MYILVALNLNIFLYIVSIFFLFSILFIFDLSAFKSLNDLKFCTGLNITRFSLLIILLSLSGIPPFIGFLTKLVLFVYLFTSSSWFYLLLFSIFNIFSMYFYIQNIKLTIKYTKPEYFLTFNNKVYLPYKLIIFLQSGLFFFICGFFFINDLLIFFSYITMFVFLN